MKAGARSVAAMVGLRRPLLDWLCVGAGAWQALIITGYLVEGYGSSTGIVWISVAAMLIGLGIALYFAIRACVAVRTSRVDWWVLIVLAANPLWFSSVLWCSHRKPSDSLVESAGFIAAHSVPALLFSIRIHHLLGSSRIEHDQLEPSRTSRILTLMFLSILLGGWTAGLAGLVYPISDPSMFDLNGDYTVTPYEKMLGGLRFAAETQWIGSVLGFLTGVCIVVPLVSNTKLNRSVPVVFLPPLLVGVGTTFVDPFMAIVLTGMTVIATSVIANRLFDLRSPRFEPVNADRCQTCGYDLSDHWNRVCPECGPSNRTDLSNGS